MRKNLPLKTLHYTVGIFILIYLALVLFKFLSLKLTPFIHNYVNDIIVIPIVATIALQLVWLIKKDRSLRIGILSLTSLVTFYSIYFEYYLPMHMSRYTGDWWDVLCYAIGAMVFYILQRLP